MPSASFSMGAWVDLRLLLAAGRLLGLRSGLMEEEVPRLEAAHS
jgi:hypothetical protein